ncbi:unnamed protein product [Arabidopsis lyrata]|nr:unnamed protein product [Arabidopsis lyrata]
MLTPTNYTVCAMRMRVLLRIYKVWESIEPGTDDANKNDVAIAMLFQSILESLILQVGDQSSPRDIWGAIKTRNQGADRVKEARFQTLMSEFERIKMTDSDTIDEFRGKISEMTYEERILDEENHGETQGKLLYAYSNQYSFVTSRGRGRGRRSRGYKGHVNLKTVKTMFQQGIVHGLPEVNEEKKLCESCLVGKQTRQVFPKATMFRATKPLELLHADLCGPITPSKLDESITGKVRFGDDSQIDIKGKGSIVFIAKNGERRALHDVYYIPDLRSNILSLGQATESGCDVRMREDYLTLYDRDGKLLVKAKRSKNRLYKVIMRIPIQPYDEDKAFTSSPESSPPRMIKAKSSASEVDDTALVLMVASVNQSKSKVFNPSQHVVLFNPTHEQMWPPIYGLVHLYAKDGISQGMQNHKPKGVEKSVLFKEESDFSADMKESEKKALSNLKSKLEEAIVENTLLKTKKKESSPVKEKKEEVVKHEAEIEKKKEEAWEKVEEEKKYEAVVTKEAAKDETVVERVEEEDNKEYEEKNKEKFLRWRFQLMEAGIQKFNPKPGGVTSDEDLKYVKENTEYARFVSRLDTVAINKQCGGRVKTVEDKYEEERSKKKTLLEDTRNGEFLVDHVDVLPVKTLDGKIHYRTESKKSKLAEADTNEAEKDVLYYGNSLNISQRREKAKRSKREKKKHEKDLRNENLQEEETPQAAILAEVKEELSAADTFKTMKNKLAELKNVKTEHDKFEMKEAEVQFVAGVFHLKLSRSKSELEECVAEESKAKATLQRSVGTTLQRSVVTMLQRSVVTASRMGAIYSLIVREVEILEFGYLDEFEFKTIGENHNQERLAVEVLAAGAVLPHEIIRVLDGGEGGQVAELQWKQMVDDLKEKGSLRNYIAICDVSGSMNGDSMEVSVALNLLVSELSEEPWRGKLITFSQNPEMRLVTGDDLRSKSEFVRNMQWGMNTVFQKVFDLILRVVVKGKLNLDDDKHNILLAGMSEILSIKGEKVLLRIDKKSAIALTKNPVFHGRSKHIHRRYHFIRECVENEQVEVEHVPGNEQKADILTKPLGRIKFKEMRNLIGVQDVKKDNFKLKGENVELSLKS